MLDSNKPFLKYLNSLLLVLRMMTIHDCLGQNLLCYAVENDENTIRVYPQFIINEKHKLIEIPEGDRMRMFSSDGSFLVAKHSSYSGHPFIEAKNLRYSAASTKEVVAKFVPYLFSTYAFCMVFDNYSVEDVLSDDKLITCDTSFLPLVSQGLYLHCAGDIVGPFSYKIIDSNSIEINADKSNQCIISHYRATKLKAKRVFTGCYGMVEFLPRTQLDVQVPMLKYRYEKTRKHNDAFEDGGIVALLRQFSLLEEDENAVDLDKLKHKLYIIEHKLDFLRRILNGSAKPGEVQSIIETDIIENGGDVAELVSKRQQLQDEIASLRQEKNSICSISTQKESELKELEEKVCNSLNSKITELQGKIDEYKSVAGGVAAQIDQKLLVTIQKLVSSVTIEGDVPISTERAENVEPIGNSSFPLLPRLQFKSGMQNVVLGKEIINRIQGYLAAHNRFYTVSEVANYLVCLTQGFMTTFAGNPGSGKTSLCNLLAKSLGLVAEHDGTHFVDVPVSRGWTSAKDFIGYYNPLAKQMVRSNAAVYKALELSEQEDSGEVPPMVILLDEANLSPLEHYWSSFLKNSDFSSSSARSFSLGGDKVWKINPHLRFLATVNHDHTTEELSPRFLDRSWVILLEGQSSELDARDINIPDISGDWAAVPYAKLEEAFGVAAHSKLPMKPEVLQLWKAIRAAMQESQMPVMPRNINMVENYVKTASLYMSDTFAPLDYAMAQKILPTLSGSGERMKDCLTQLHRLCDGKLPRTASLLARMLEAGKHNMEMYQFFVS